MQAREQIEIELNGGRRELHRGSSVAALLEQLGLRPETVAVELNERLVPRERRAAAQLSEGDRVEIVTLVGGG